MKITILAITLIMLAAGLSLAAGRLDEIQGPYPNTFYYYESDSPNAPEVQAVQRISPLLKWHDCGDGLKAHEVTVTEVSPPPDPIYNYSINPTTWTR